MESYWLLKDSQQGKAVVTKELWSGHDAVEYRYIVDQKEYTGRDARGYQGSRYIKVMPGEETTVYFSGSHPWLSRLNKPRIVVEGLPVILIVMILEAFVVVTIISPKSRWAFNFSGVKRKAAVG